MKTFLSYFKSKKVEAPKKVLPERVAKVIEAYRNKNKKA
jgi:hypothetical protein